MSYLVTDKDPIIGDRQFEIVECSLCGGEGLTGQGDYSNGTDPRRDCLKCDGVGQVCKRWRWVYAGVVGVSYSAWEYGDPCDI